MIEFDNSYYSSVRNNSIMDAFLIKNKIPPLTNITQEPATVTFSNITEKNNPVTIEVPEFLNRPIGNFSLWVKSKILKSTGMSDESEEHTTISFNVLDGREAEKAYIFINDYDVDNIVTKALIEYYSKEDNLISEYIYPESEVIEIKAREGELLKHLKVTLLEGQRRARVEIGAILYGAEVVKVDNDDFENVEILTEGDLTCAKRYSETINLTLFNNKNLYSADINTILVNMAYCNKDGSKSKRKPKLFNVAKGNAKIIDNLDIVRIKIKGEDLLSVLTEKYSFKSLYTNDFCFIEDILQRSDQVYKDMFSIQSDVETFRASDAVPFGANIISLPQNVAIHSISAFSKRLSNMDLDMLKIPFASDVLKKEPKYNISFNEQYNIPEEKIYPKIRVFTNKFEIKTEKAKELLLQQENIYVAPQIPYEYVIPDDYYIPTSRREIIYINGIDIMDIEGLDYLVLDGKLHIYYFEGELGSNLTLDVYGIPLETYSKKWIKNINEEGEDLELRYRIIENPELIDQELFYKKSLQVYDINKEFYLNLRGRFEIDLYDIIIAELRRNQYYKCIVTKHNLKYNGTFKSELTVAVLEPFGNFLLPSNKLKANVSLLPSNELKEVL